MRCRNDFIMIDTLLQMKTIKFNIYFALKYFQKLNIEVNLNFLLTLQPPANVTNANRNHLSCTNLNFIKKANKRISFVKKGVHESSPLPVNITQTSNICPLSLFSGFLVIIVMVLKKSSSV